MAQAGEWTTEVDMDYRYYRKPADELNYASTLSSTATQTQAQVINTYYKYFASVNPPVAGVPTTVPTSLATTSAVVPGNNDPSIAIQPSYFNEWDNRTNAFSFKPFFRYDNMDTYRTHADIREMVWLSKHGTVNHPWELRVGIDKVFWGTAESNHLVDVINQTDLIENIDRESKLGQPMVHATLLDRGWGTLDMFVLPWFRERTFSGPNGRLRPSPALATLPVLFQSGSGQNHVDYALRWSKSYGGLDIGISEFDGTDRDPRVGTSTSLITAANPAGEYLSYDQMGQTSLDMSYVSGNLIYKAEALHRDTNYDHFWAAVSGFEYQFNGVMHSPYDLNAFLEYNYDSRQDPSTILFQSDVFVGFRLNFNDEKSTELELGVFVDTNDSSRSTHIKFDQRLNDHWSIVLEGQWYNSIDSGNLLNYVKADSYLSSSLVRYF